MLKNVSIALANILVGHLAYGSRRGDFPNKEKCGEDHPNFDCQSEVGENCKEEGGRPDSDVEVRKLQEFRNFPPLAHVVRNNEENPRKDRQQR